MMMTASRPRSAMVAMVGSSIGMSLRLAPSMAQPIGMPLASTASDHFQPSLARSVGFSGSFAAARSFVE